MNELLVWLNKLRLTISPEVSSLRHSFMRSMRLLLSLSSCGLGLWLRCNLVPSCFVVFDLELLSLSFDFVFCLRSLNLSPCLSLSSLPSCALCDLTNMLTISLDRLDILEDLCLYQSLRKSLSLCLEHVFMNIESSVTSSSNRWDPSIHVQSSYVQIPFWGFPWTWD